MFLPSADDGLFAPIVTPVREPSIRSEVRTQGVVILVTTTGQILMTTDGRIIGTTQ